MQPQMKNSHTFSQFRQILILTLLIVITAIATACDLSTSPVRAEPTPQSSASQAFTTSEVAPVEVPLDQNLRFGHLTTLDGLSEGRVWDITQDSKGFMWFASFDGLNRFDGYEFEVFKEERDNLNSPGGNAFFALQEDLDGMLWVGSALGGGLSRFDPVTEQWTRFQHDPDDPNSLSNDNVYSVFEDSEGTIWIGTDGGGLNRFDGESEDGKGQFTHFLHDEDDPNSLGSDFAIFIYEDRAGELWVSTVGGGLNQFDRETETFTRYPHDPDDPCAGNLAHPFYF